MAWAEAPVARRANILLMTATVTPANTPDLARTDPKLRLEDYRAALLFYLGHLGGVLDGIVFVENSNSDVSSLVELARARGGADQVEFIVNYGEHSYPGRERAYGESRLLDHAMAHSRLIAVADADAVIWKITGRYTVVNLAKMIRTAPRRFDIYCDARKRPMPWLDLRFMAWTKAGYDRVLRDIAERIGTDPKEQVMYAYVTGLRDPAVVLRYRAEPLVDGVRGWDNHNYAKGVARLKFLLRVAARRLAPALWI